MRERLPPRRRREQKRECPWCGALVPVNAAACRECGSDARTGWKDPDVILAEAVELPEAELGEDAYDEFIRREFGSGELKRKARKSWRVLFLVAVLAVTAAAIALAALRWR
ncbi:MAG: hypothetical protein AB1486_02625 [Planctomycetota bacterium]